MCSRPGPGSAITPAPATCTPAPARWSSATAANFPASEAELRALPGIGAYTAAAIAAIAFDRPATPVDGNIERVIARLYAVETPLPAAKPEIRRARAAALTPQQRAGDFAQAMMDLGATICTPKNPACALCPWNDGCAAHARGDAETFPRKAPKREGTLRRGAAFVVLRADGFVLVRTRPAKGLLGGMTEVPTTQWTHDFDEGKALDRRAALCVDEQCKSAWHGAGSPASCATCSRISRWNSRSTPPTFRRARAAPPARAGSRSRDSPARLCRALMRKVVAHALP